jgi:hypothetical protein
VTAGREEETPLVAPPGAAAGDDAAAAGADLAGTGAPAAPARRWARNTATALFLAAVAGLITLSVIGFKPALYLLVLAVVGTCLVILGARLH